MPDYSKYRAIQVCYMGTQAEGLVRQGWVLVDVVYTDTLQTVSDFGPKSANSYAPPDLVATRGVVTRVPVYIVGQLEEDRVVTLNREVERLNGQASSQDDLLANREREVTRLEAERDKALEAREPLETRVDELRVELGANKTEMRKLEAKVSKIRRMIGEKTFKEIEEDPT